MQITFSEGQAGKRLDQLVSEAMTRLSRAYVQKLCKDGRVTLNGMPAKSGQKLKFGDKISVDYDETALNEVAQLDLPILYEDEDCVVINKPAGVLTHAPTALSLEPSVASFLRSRQNPNPPTLSLSGIKPQTGRENANFARMRVGIVHRLDRATSGVMVGAKHQAALSWLQKQFSARKVKKTYVAVVEGVPKQSEAIIDMPLERNPKAPATFRVGANGRAATTHYRVMQSGRKCSLVELKPEPAEPISCEYIWPELATRSSAIRSTATPTTVTVRLHALSLEITLPSRQRKTFTASLPPEFQKAL